MRDLALVAIGGAAGATARWGCGQALPLDGAGFPWATLLVNVFGCLAIGVAARGLVRGSPAWLLVVTGGLGGLTTFSGFAVETESLLAAGRPAVAAAYVIITMTAGLGATHLARRGRV